ncbi:MAG: hypothetical protein V2A64_08120 [Candidatus Omnitrophota bacterium]
MSIIYEALKKIDNSIAPSAPQPHHPQEKSKKPRNKLFILLYAAVVIAGCFIASIIFNFFTAKNSGNPALIKQANPDKKGQPKLNANQNSFNKPAAAKTPVSPQNILSPLLTKITAEIKQRQAPEGLILTGLFFSENQDSFALINNQILKEGDVINGAAVKRISLNEVELERNGSIIKLSNNE